MCSGLRYRTSYFYPGSSFKWGLHLLFSGENSPTLSPFFLTADCIPKPRGEQVVMWWGEAGVAAEPQRCSQRAAGSETQTRDVYPSAPRSPWPPVSLSHSVSVSTKRLIRETFFLQASPSVFFIALFFTFSACFNLVAHILSSLCRIHSVHTESTGFDLCFCTQAADSVFTCVLFILCVCVCVHYVHICVFHYLPRLGIKCQSLRLMFSLIERHSRNESIAAYRWE